MSLRKRQRERLSGKTGRMEIDYKILYDAFFKFGQDPPPFTSHGDIYYEGKEFEAIYKFS